MMEIVILIQLLTTLSSAWATFRMELEISFIIVDKVHQSQVFSFIN